MLQEIPAFETFKSFAQIKIAKGMVDSVNARELYALMDKRTAFSTWAKQEIVRAVLFAGPGRSGKKLSYVEDIDYIITTDPSSGRRPKIEYIVTIRTAQNLLTTSDSHAGDLYRHYLYDVAEMLSQIKDKNKFIKENV